MKNSSGRVLAIVGVCLLFCCRRAPGADVKFQFQNAQALGLTNRTMNLYPTGGPFTNGAGVIVTRDWVSGTTDTNGSLTLSNVYGWTYRSELQGTKTSTTNYYNFPVTNGLILAATYVSTPTNKDGTLAYTQSQSDSNFLHRAGDNGVNLTNVNGTNIVGTLTNNTSGQANVALRAGVVSQPMAAVLGVGNDGSTFTVSSPTPAMVGAQPANPNLTNFSGVTTSSIPYLSAVNQFTTVNTFAGIDRTRNQTALNRWFSSLVNSNRALKILAISDLTGFPGTYMFPSLSGLLGKTGNWIGYGSAEGELAQVPSAGMTTVDDTSVMFSQGKTLDVMSGSGHVLTWTRRGTGGAIGVGGLTVTNFYATTGVVFCVAGPSESGSYQLKGSLNGGTFNNIGSVVNVNNATKQSLPNAFTLAPGLWTIRADWVSGTVKFPRVGGYWDDSQKCLSYGALGLNNAGIADILACSTNCTWPIFKAINPDLILYLDTTGPVSESSFGSLMQMFTNCCPSAAIALLGNHNGYAGYDDSVNIQLQTNADKYGCIYIDMAFALGTNLTEIAALNYTDGTVHPNDPGLRRMDSFVESKIKPDGSFANAYHVDGVFAGPEVNLFNTTRTNNLGIGIAQKNALGRLHVSTGYGNFILGDVGVGVAGLWLGTTISSTTAANALFQTDGINWWFQPPGGIAGGQIIAGVPGGTERFRLNADGGFVVGAQTGNGLGTITANAGFYGSAANLTSANATTLFGSGTVPTARLGSGSATANTVLHGNQTYGAVSLTSDVTGTLPAGNLPSGSVILTAFKSASTDRTSTTTLADDPVLTVNCTSGNTYEFEVFVKFLAPSATPGFKFSIVFPTITADGDMEMLETGGDNAAPLYNGLPQYGSWDIVNPYTGAVTGFQNGYMRMRGLFKAASTAALKLQWAQNTSSTDLMRVCGGSFIKVRQLN